MRASCFSQGFCLWYKSTPTPKCVSYVVWAKPRGPSEPLPSRPTWALFGASCVKPKQIPNYMIRWWATCGVSIVHVHDLLSTQLMTSHQNDSSISPSVSILLPSPCKYYMRTGTPPVQPTIIVFLHNHLPSNKLHRGLSVCAFGGGGISEGDT